MGIRVGTDGIDDLVMLAPVQVPGDVRRFFERELWAHRRAIIDFIEEENAGGRA